jgi:eukaryotic-like serine/threonine-protein kinase
LTDTIRWNRVRELFDQALDLPQGEVGSFLREQCGADEELLAEVKGLLRADETPHSMLGAPALASFDPFADDSLIGERIGAYRIEKLIASGGMGAVYLANRDDGQFTQQVALKLIKRGMDSAEIIRRFQSERQILANLEHPNIARLIDGGVADSGQPYFAMEYVDGIPITRYCDKHELSISSRLELFKTACEAVQFAHQNLVVHRDLKPSNILVDSSGAVKLLDFGIAKALSEETEREHQTRTGFRVMTPGYASPEQVRAEPVTTASDVYSLGVVIFELLIGQRPHNLDGLTPREVERKLSEEEPTRPSVALSGQWHTKNTDTERSTDSLLTRTKSRAVEPEKLKRLLKGDLDNICLMAVRTSAERRYRSAGQLLEDIERYQNRMPVRARPDTTAYRMQKFLARNKTATLTIGVGVIVAISLTVFYTLKLSTERDRAQLEATKAKQTAEFVTSLFGAADPNVAQGKELTARELLEQGRMRIDDELAGQPEVQALMLLTIGKSYGQLGLMEKERETVRDALARYYEASNPAPEGEIDILDELGFVNYSLGKLDSALYWYERAYEKSALHYGEVHPVTQYNMSSLGSTLREMGNNDSAVVVLRKAIGLARQLPDIDSLDLAHPMNQLGRLLSLEGKHQEAEPYLLEGYAIRQAVLGEDNFEVCASRGSLAGMYILQGKFESAAELYLQNIATLRKLVGNSHHFVGGALGSLANIKREMKDYVAADSLYQQSYETLRATLPKGHVNLAVPLVGMALLNNNRRDYLKAIAELDTAIALRTDQLGTDHWMTATALVALGESYFGLQHLDKSRSTLEQARQTLINKYGPEHRLVQRANLTLEKVYTAQNDSLALKALSDSKK